MDRILDLDIFPDWLVDVLVCQECSHIGPPKSFADLAATRTDHQFKPLLQWVEEVLLPARVLEITLPTSGFSSSAPPCCEKCYRLVNWAWRPSSGAPLNR
jgi:hypothetical protein